MKRFFILISCILLIVSLSVSAFAAAAFYDWQDYIASTTPGVDYDINDIFFPPDALSVRWNLFVNDSIVANKATDGFYFSTSSEQSVSSWRLTFNLNTYMHFDVSTIGLQDSLDVHFWLDGYAPDDMYYTAEIVYYNSDDKRISADTVTSPTISAFEFMTVPIDLTRMPSGTHYISFKVDFHGSTFEPGYYFSIAFTGISFEVLTEGTLTPIPDPEPDPEPDPDPSDPSTPVLPGLISLPDYVVTESSNGNISTLRVSVPSRELCVLWHMLRSDDFSTITNVYDNDFSIFFDRHDYDYWVDCQVLDKFDISDIVDGSTLSVDFAITSTVKDSEPVIGGVRYQVRYYDVLGNLIDSVKFFDIPDADWFDDTKLDIVVDKPEGAVYMSFIVQFMDIWSEQLPCAFSLDLASVDFVCDIPTMVRVQEETGKTNKLLHELVHGDHGFDSSGSNFGSEADQLAGAGNQMNDAMGSGMNSLGSMTNSVAFTGTLTTLAGVMDAVFVGHEITICGVTANPFILLVSIFAIAILLPLGLKFVFRKWGSGGG